MLIILNKTPPWPSFCISLMSAEPLAMSRKETRTGRPLESLPSQEPASDLSWSNDFWAEIWAKAAVSAKEGRGGRGVRGDFMLSISFWNFGIGFWGRTAGSFILDTVECIVYADRIQAAEVTAILARGRGSLRSTRNDSSKVRR